MSVALTYTLAGLQSILDLVDTAITGSDWDGALMQISRANLVLSGLPASAASDTQSFSMRQDLARAADLVAKARAAVVDSKRTVRVGVRHLTSGPSRRTSR